MIDLKEVRRKIYIFFEDTQVKNAPYGAYHTGLQTQETDLYAFCDVAIARHIMGEELTETLSQQWSASHLFWGGIHCYSLSKECDKAWLDFVFDWLNENLDENTGWWRKNTVYTDRHQPLGGSVHIIPIYQHHHRVFPYPKQVINSVLALQLPSGQWLSRENGFPHMMHYLELDALYALDYMSTLAPGYRKEDIMKAVNTYADLVDVYWNATPSIWQNQHPHRVLSMVGTFGLLQKLLPDRFVDSVQWTDIFSDIQLYNTASIEAI